jgi:hypothetical protein
MSSSITTGVMVREDIQTKSVQVVAMSLVFKFFFFFFFFFFYMKNSLALARHANLASIIFIFDPSMILLSLPFNYALDVMYEYSCNI